MSNVRVLFLSYNGLLEPILPSQSVPYLTELAKKGYDFTLLTYEKPKDLKRTGAVGIKAMKKDLRGRGIEWVYLKYHKTPRRLSTIFDLAMGVIYTFFIIITRRVKIVHLRGVTPGTIMLLLSGIFKVKVLFDMRGLLAEEYVGGGLWSEGGLSFKMVKKIEERLLNMSDAVTVLTKKHMELNKKIPGLDKKPMDVIPCCVDMKRFCRDLKARNELRQKLGVEGKFVLMYPGKVGTFYLMKEMLEFYKVMLGSIPDSVFIILTNDNMDLPLKEAGISDLLGGRIRVMKAVRFEDMPLYTRMADAGIFFINPYKKIGSSPIKMGEFLASGVPVIINPGVGDTEELVRDNGVGVVVDSFTEEEYKKGVSAILKLKQDKEALERRCREAAEKGLSLDDAVIKYAKIYDMLSAVER